MLSQIGDAIPHGADALGGNLFLPDGGGALHFRQIRIKQQRTVMHDFAAQSILCGAGKFASGHGQVVAAVEFGGNPQFAKRPQYRGEKAAKIDLAFPRRDEGILPSAQIRIDGSSARKPAHHADAALLGVRQIDFFQRVLVAADHQRRLRLPEEKEFVPDVLLRGEEIFGREIVAGVGGIRFQINHGVLQARRASSAR